MPQLMSMDRLQSVAKATDQDMYLISIRIICIENLTKPPVYSYNML